MKRIFDHIFLLRPTLWVPLWTFFLLGVYRGRIVSAERIHAPRIALALVLYTLLMGATYILNQIVDIESDRANKKLYLLPEGHISVAHARIQLVLLFVFSWALAVPFSGQFKIILLSSMVLGILYSAPPFGFKGRPILDLLSNALGYGVLAFLLGWATVAPFSGRTLLYSLPYFFAVGAVFINTTIPDAKGDKRAGEITTGVFLGESRSYWLSTAFILISLAFSLFLKDWMCGITAACAVPLFLWAAIRRSQTSCFVSIRVSAPILAILIGTRFWWFIPLLIVVLLSLRVYYKLRFNVTYPKIA